MIFFNLLLELFLKKTELNKKIKYDFFNQHSFSLPNSAKYDRLIGLRQCKRFFFKLWSSKKKTSNHYFENDVLGCYLYDISSGNIKEKANYVFKESGTELSGLFVRDDLLLDLPLHNRVVFSISALIFYPLISILVFFRKKNRINIALFPELLIECSVLINQLIKVGCEKIYFFSTHEPEANLLAHFLKRENIRVVKIPNSNPLFMFNKSMVTDELILTLEYQFEEAKLFYPDQDFEITRWQPFGLTQYYNKLERVHINKNLCYYSHASWIRKDEDHHLPWFNEVELELDLLDKISKSKYFKSNKIHICLHPKEKASFEVLERAKKYYQDIFGQNVEFYYSNKNSFEAFKEFDLGFGAFSSILFERIQCGYKTLIFNNKINEFPIAKSNFNYFVIDDFDTFLKRIHLTMDLKFEEFFNTQINYTFKK